MRSFSSYETVRGGGKPVTAYKTRKQAEAKATQLTKDCKWRPYTEDNEKDLPLYEVCEIEVNLEDIIK